MASIHELYKLYRSSEKQNTAIFDFLRDTANEEYVKDPNEKGETVLDLACDDDDYPLVQRLLDADVYIHMSKIHKLYLLHKTSKQSNNTIFDYIKNAGNNESINTRSEEYKTVLNLAYNDDNYLVVKVLLELDIFNTLPIIHKLYLLYKTSAHQNMAILGFLKDPAYIKFIEDANNEEQTILHLAAYDDEWEIVYLLIELSADINKRDKHNRTPLNYCIDCRHINRMNIPLIQLLIARGANINEADEWGFTSLHYAVVAGNLNKAGILISLGADIDQTNRNLETPIRLAFQSNTPNKNLMLQLLFKNSDIISQDFSEIILSPGLTDGVVVIGSTLWDPALRKLVPITRATPGFENAITNAEEFRQAAEANEKEFNELSKTDVTAKRRYNYKAIGIITKNKTTPEMQALHIIATEFEKRTEPRTRTLKEVPAHLLAKQCIFSKFDARVKLEQDLAKAPADLQDLVAKEIHAMAVAKSTKYQ